MLKAVAFYISFYTLQLLQSTTSTCSNFLYDEYFSEGLSRDEHSTPTKSPRLQNTAHYGRFTDENFKQYSEDYLVNLGMSPLCLNPVKEWDNIYSTYPMIVRRRSGNYSNSLINTF